MTPEVQQFVKEMQQTYALQGKMLEIGAYDVNGNVRHCFVGSDYIGTDMTAGPNVDVVINAHDLLQVYQPDSFDVILCLETFEHDSKFWVTLDNIKTLLKQGGYFIVSAPAFHFPEHRYPKDYWRFSQDSFSEVLMDGYDMKDFRKFGNGLCAIGQKK